MVGETPSVPSFPSKTSKDFEPFISTIVTRCPPSILSIETVGEKASLP